MDEEPDVLALEETLLLAVLARQPDIEAYLLRDRLHLRGVFLLDRYPHTQLIIKCLDEAGVREGTFTFEVSDFALKELGPDSCAGIIATNIEEGLWMWSAEDAAFRSALTALDPPTLDALRNISMQDPSDPDAIAAAVSRYSDSTDDELVAIIEMAKIHPLLWRRLGRALDDLGPSARGLAPPSIHRGAEL